MSPTFPYGENLRRLRDRRQEPHACGVEPPLVARDRGSRGIQSGAAGSEEGAHFRGQRRGGVGEIHHGVTVVNADSGPVLVAERDQFHQSPLQAVR